MVITFSNYQQATALANEMQISQSELFTLALEEYLHHYHTHKLLQSINEAYADDLDPSEQAMLGTFSERISQPFPPCL